MAAAAKRNRRSDTKRLGEARKPVVGEFEISQPPRCPSRPVLCSYMLSLSTRAGVNMWVFGTAIVQAILIGWIAQTQLKRTGIVWFLIALAVDAALLLLVDVSTDPRKLSPEELRIRNSLAGEISYFLLSVGIGSVVMGIVLATLPKVREPRE